MRDNMIKMSEALKAKLSAPGADRDKIKNTCNTAGPSWEKTLKKSGC